MNRDYIIERIFTYILVILIPLVCYFLAGKLVVRSKYTGKIKRYLIMLIASLVCFLFFIFYGMIANTFDVSIKLLNPLYYLLVPVSFLSILAFSMLFFLHKNRS